MRIHVTLRLPLLSSIPLPFQWRRQPLRTHIIIIMLMLAQDYTVEISSTRTVYYVHPANGLTTWEVRKCWLALSGSWPIQCCAISTTHHITGSTGYDSLYLYPVLPNIMKCVWITMPALSVHSERRPRLCLHSGIQIEAYIEVSLSRLGCRNHAFHRPM